MKRTRLPQLEELVRTALRLNTTDLFLLPDEPPVMRIAGSIQRADADIFSAEDIEAFVEAAFGKSVMEEIGTAVGEMHRSFSLPGEAHVVICAARAAVIIRCRQSFPESGLALLKQVFQKRC